MEFMHSRISILRFFLITIVIIVVPGTCREVAADRNVTLSALVSFKEAIDGDPTGFFSSWNPSSNPNYCTWPGVLCELDDVHVTSLHLDLLQLNGTISWRIADLMPHLVSFNISNNAFYGSIPAQIANPNSTSLLEFDVSVNNLSGSVPISIAKYFTGLRYLALNDNDFSANVTVFLNSLSNTSMNLNYLDLSSNKGLSGTLPPQVGQLSGLRVLRLHDCDLHGTIPETLSNCSMLQIIDLRNCLFLTGTIPDSFGSLSHLTQLMLSFNSLHGSIPGSIVNCSNLSFLWLSNNYELTGSIPSGIGKLQRLQYLRLTDNRLMTGNLPDSIGQCSLLEQISFQYNNGRGPMPLSLFNLSNLHVLRLTSCGLTGSLSEQIRNLKALETLRLSFNSLDGTIPGDLGQLKNLQGMDLEGNNFAGTIPSELSGCTQLSNMDLSHNSLSGSIPSSFSKLESIRNVSLQYNSLSGELPDIFNGLTRLMILNLSHNMFTGQIPYSLANLATLGLSLDLSYNMITGPLPSSLGTMQMLVSMILSNNSFTGGIPVSLESCAGLQVLDLSWNSLQGKIPDEFGGMDSLQFLDLSHNQLTGELPLSLANLSSLVYLNVSYNDLQGSIPSGGIYQKSSSSSFIGNERLCGFPLSNICRSKDNNHFLRIGIPVIVSVSVTGIAAIGLVYCYHRRDTSKSDARDDMAEMLFDYLNEPVIKSWTLGEIRSLTDNFSAQNVIGTGSTSVCYKGIVFEDTENITVLAIKRFKLFDLNDIEPRTSFINELRTICKMRHRNLVKMLGYCVEGVEAALVMEYMEEGDLHDYLHGRHGKQTLSWEERLSIAVDVAEALVYLHHEYANTVVHCDLKPKNILLGADKVAKISDFGIARQMNYTNTGEGMSASTFRGTFGYAAPEYMESLRISTQVDVYSYGVLLIELMSGVSPTSPTMQELGISLQVWAARLKNCGRMADILDMSSRDAAKQNPSIIEEANLLLDIAFKCCSDNPRNRPTMISIRNCLCTSVK